MMKSISTMTSLTIESRPLGRCDVAKVALYGTVMAM